MDLKGHFFPEKKLFLRLNQFFWESRKLFRGETLASKEVAGWSCTAQ
jgi:hypothetical protein